MSACPHCSRSVRANRLVAHTRVCVQDPVVAERVKEGLRQVSPFGVLLSWEDYRVSVAGRDGMPSYRTLRWQIGDWDAIARWAGLRPYGELSEEIWGAARKRLRDLSYKFYDGLYGPCIEDWEDGRAYYLPRAAELMERLGSWSAVLGWAGGMEEASPSYYALMARDRELRARKQAQAKARARIKLMEVEAALIEQDRNAAVGVEVCKPRNVTYYDWRTRSYYQCSAASIR